MQYKVNMSLLARDKLDEIFSYITNKLFNKTAATAIADEPEKKISILQETPFAFEASRD